MRRIIGLPGTRLAALLHALLLTALLSLHGCSSGPPPPPPSTEGRALSAGGAAAVSLSAAAPVSPPRLVFKVSVRYPASLLYALDRAASARDRDPRYQKWLFGTETVALPSWFSTYATRRDGWRTSRDEGNGPYEPYAACSHDAETLAVLLDCAGKLLSPADLASARTALEQTDALLHARWVKLEPVLRQWQGELQAITSGAQGAELAQLLARSAQLPDEQQLTFEVVLVAKPRSDESRANQAGGHLVVEVSDDLPAVSQAHVLFHEIAHLAARHAPGRAALEQAFGGRGTAGLVAANLWSEAFATAFGNGMAAERLDPRFKPERSFYQDEGIDALGHALYRRWRAGTAVTLDASLAELLLGLLDTSWPRERWRLADVTRRLVVFSDDRESGNLILQGLRAQSLYLSVPIPTELDLPEKAAASTPRLVLATLTTLRQRPDLLRLVGLDLAQARSRMAANGAGLYWQEGGAGALLLIAAATRKGLLAATRAFVALPTLPPTGWTTLSE